MALADCGTSYSAYKSLVIENVTDQNPDKYPTTQGKHYEQFLSEIQNLKRIVGVYAEERFAEISNLNVLATAKIAKKVIERHRPQDAVLEVLDYLDGPAEICEALKYEHDNLRPIFVEQLVDSAVSIGVVPRALAKEAEERPETNMIADKCMAQALAAMKAEPPFKELLEHSPSKVLHQNPSESPEKIKKRRSWKEIEEESKK